MCQVILMNHLDDFLVITEQHLHSTSKNLEGEGVNTQKKPHIFKNLQLTRTKINFPPIKLRMILKSEIQN